MIERPPEPLDPLAREARLPEAAPGGIGGPAVEPFQAGADPAEFCAELLDRVGLPSDFTGFGVREDDLPTIADERFDVGALGFGVMSGVAGLGALSAGVLDARSTRRRRPWRTLTFSGAAFGATTLALAAAGSFAVALVAVAGVGASGLLFQTSSQSLMLQMSAFEYHGRLQSFVILGFSGFGLAALPLGYLADSTSVGFVLSVMGIAVLAMTAAFVAVAWRLRRKARTLAIG